MTGDKEKLTERRDTALAGLAIEKRLRRREDRLYKKLNAVLGLPIAHRARTFNGVLLKLLIADDFDEYRKEASDPASTYVTPKLIASVIQELQEMLGYTDQLAEHQ